MNLPAKMGYEGAQTRWDDVMFSHVNSTNVVHDVVCNLDHSLPLIPALTLNREVSYRGIGITCMHMRSYSKMSAGTMALNRKFELYLTSLTSISQ